MSVSSNVGAAMIAGQIKVGGCCTTDDVPVLEEQMGKKLAIVSTFKEVAPVSHYNLIVSTRKSLEQKRPAFARVLAGLIDATRFMVDPKNADRVASIATVNPAAPCRCRSRRSRISTQIKYWPLEDDGLGKANLDRVIAAEKDVGGISRGRRPVARTSGWSTRGRVEGRGGAAEELGGARCWIRSLEACGGRIPTPVSVLGGAALWEFAGRWRAKRGGSRPPLSATLFAPLGDDRDRRAAREPGRIRSRCFVGRLRDIARS